MGCLLLPPIWSWIGNVSVETTWRGPGGEETGRSAEGGSCVLLVREVAGLVTKGLEGLFQDCAYSQHSWKPPVRTTDIRVSDLPSKVSL